MIDSGEVYYKMESAYLRGSSANSLQTLGLNADPIYCVVLGN